MDTPSETRDTFAEPNDPIDEIRRIFEIAVALDAARREAWLMENIANPATRQVVKRLVEADGQPGLFDVSVLRLLDAICGPDQTSKLASARRAP